MPYDFARGFNTGGWDPSGFAGRSTGSYFAPVYGYGEGGTPISTRTGVQTQLPKEPARPAAMQPMGGGDFFSQLAGLLGASKGPQMPAQTGPDWSKPFGNPQYDIAKMAPGQAFQGFGLSGLQTALAAQRPQSQFKAPNSPANAPSARFASRGKMGAQF